MASRSVRVLVPLAHGSEEIELVTIVDVLRRGKLVVDVASVESTLECLCSRGVRITADVFFGDAAGRSYDAVVLAGGAKGAEKFRDYSPLIDLLKAFSARGHVIGAVCASPAVVLAHHGLLDRVNATCYPTLATLIPQLVTGKDVVIDGNVITSRGPGTSMSFALALVERLAGASMCEEVKSGLLHQ